MDSVCLPMSWVAMSKFKFVCINPSRPVTSHLVEPSVLPESVKEAEKPELEPDDENCKVDLSQQFYV
jgi:hypothetical protein